MRPTQTREAVDDGFWQIAVIPVFVKTGRTVALGELFAITSEHRRRVTEQRWLGAERTKNIDLTRCVHHVTITANHMRNRHVDIVNDHTEVVSWRADFTDRSGPRDDEIVEFGVGNFDMAFHGIIPCDDACVRVAEADDGQRALGFHESKFGGVFRTPAPVVTWLFAFFFLFHTQRIERVYAHVAVIRAAIGQHLRDHFAVARHALHLVERAFVDVESEPIQVAQNTVGA